MAGQTTQQCDPVKDVQSIITHIWNEEEGRLATVAGSVKVGELAEILGGQARDPRWIGAGWEGELGDGVDPSDPEAVTGALGISPRKQTRVQAWSILLTAPKGFSLAVTADPELRKWFNETVRPLMTAAAMEALEARSVVRLGSGNSKDREKVPVAGLRGWWAGHSISGAGDPHLHNHLIVSACAKTEDGHVGQIDGDQLLRIDAKIADGAARRVLMEEAAKVGLRFGLDGELVGIDSALIEKASVAGNAVDAIKAALAADGVPVGHKQAWITWRQIAEGKDAKGVSPELIAAIRKARGEGLTMGAEELERLLDEMLSNEAKAKDVGKWLGEKYEIGESDWLGLGKKARAAGAVEPDYDDVTRVIALMATLPRAPKPEVVAGLCARFVELDQIDNLMERVGRDRRVLLGEKHWVLTAQWKREQELRERVNVLLALSEGDMTIVEALANVDAPLVVITGVAGAGKSSALKEAAPVWAEAGVKVWGTARNRMTASETGKASGAKESLSLAALSRRIATGRGRVPQLGDIVIVDEFGLIDSADVEMLIGLAEAGVRVKALGDAHQIQPIDGSASARMVMDLAQARTAHHLARSYRTEEWADLHEKLRAVVVAGGRVRRAMMRLTLRVATDAAGVVAIAAEFEGSEIATQTNALRVQIAEALPRSEMPLDAKGEPIVAMLRDNIAGWAGDQIVVRKNTRGLVGDVTNGQRGAIVEVARGRVTVNVDGELIILNEKDAREALALGGVQTGSAAQGQTWDGRAIVPLTGMETREWLYSVCTRGRKAPVIVPIAENDEEARAILKSVLERSGIAQTTEEMAKEDAVLAASIAESESGENEWMPPEGGIVPPAPEVMPEPEPEVVVVSPVVPVRVGSTHGYDPLSEPEPEVVRESQLTAISELPDFLSEGEIAKATAAAERAQAAYADAVAEGVGVRTLTRLQDAAVAASSQAEDAREMRESLIEFLSDEERIEVDA
ncbi:MAG: AAA family ATPase, partial [Ferrimicrobium sp.]